MKRGRHLLAVGIALLLPLIVAAQRIVLRRSSPPAGHLTLAFARSTVCTASNFYQESPGALLELCAWLQETRSGRASNAVSVASPAVPEPSPSCAIAVAGLLVMVLIKRRLLPATGGSCCAASCPS